MKIAVAASLVSVTSAGYHCPGGPFLTHAGLRMTSTVAASCDTVKAEMRARVAGENGWYDQHNRGTYTEQNYGGDISFSRETGDGKYTDKMSFVLTEENGSCKVEGCSESQVFSILDMSTNYCEQKLLYCGSDEGCNVAHSDFTHSEDEKRTMAGASTNFGDCLKVEDASEKVAKTEPQVYPSGKEYQCPGSPAWLHAGLKMTSTLWATCDEVKAEVLARVAGENGWYDQHNRGTYTQQNYGGDLSFSRLTGDGKYTDKIILVLTPDPSPERDVRCEVKSCSEAQVTSVADFGTNYCEQRLLICGSDEGCLFAHRDLTASEDETITMAGASTGIRNCLKAEEVV